jgi:hypothetical protein
MFCTPPKGRIMFCTPPEGRSMFCTPPEGRSMFCTPPKGRSMFCTPPEGRRMFCTPPEGRSMFCKPPYHRMWATTAMGVGHAVACAPPYAGCDAAQRPRRRVRATPPRACHAPECVLAVRGPIRGAACNVVVIPRCRLELETQLICVHN